MTWKEIQLMKDYLLANGYTAEELYKMTIIDIREKYEEMKK